jgi:hypothetical protein
VPLDNSLTAHVLDVVAPTLRHTLWLVQQAGQAVGCVIALPLLVEVLLAVLLSIMHMAQQVASPITVMPHQRQHCVVNVHHALLESCPAAVLVSLSG